MSETMASEVLKKGKLAKEASFILNEKTTEEKNNALEKIAEQLLIDEDEIIAENEKDLVAGKENNLTESVLDRIKLNKERIKDISEAVKLLIELSDPIGENLETIEKDNGMVIKKQRVPLGVVGMIYEARPNVTVDAATLSLKTSNAVILRGSSSAKHSNIALVKSIHKALEQTEVPVDAVQLIEDTNRETVKELFDMTQYLDVLIPRGGQKLIDLVVKNSIVPVLETGAGNCHLYIDESADYKKAEAIVINAKTQRPSVCNAIEGIVIHENWLKQHGEKLLNALIERGVELRGDAAAIAVCDKVKQATEEDFKTEFLDLILSVKTVKDVTEAIQHSNTCGTKHSEGIITEDLLHAKQFLNSVDATSVYHNVSTRFTDGSEFGYGAEIGISTQKLHARGPMGLPALTSTKYLIYGDGQIRE